LTIQRNLFDRQSCLWQPKKTGLYFDISAYFVGLFGASHHPIQCVISAAILGFGVGIITSILPEGLI
jgi:hypothetical protein